MHDIIECMTRQPIVRIPPENEDSSAPANNALIAEGGLLDPRRSRAGLMAHMHVFVLDRGDAQYIPLLESCGASTTRVYHPTPASLAAGEGMGFPPPPSTSFFMADRMESAIHQRLAASNATSTLASTKSIMSSPNHNPNPAVVDLAGVDDANMQYCILYDDAKGKGSFPSFFFFFVFFLFFSFSFSLLYLHTFPDLLADLFTHLLCLNLNICD